MTTKQFLEHVLPDVGEYICWVKETKRHYAGTLDEIVHHIEREDRASKTVYHACGSFFSGGVRNNDTVCALKAFWLDIDSKVLTRKEQLQKLILFCKELNLDVPTLVDSGNGIHAYWTLSENIDIGRWEGTSALLKIAVNKFGLDVDHSRTTDAASLLRPVGTMNRKDSDNPKPVRLLKLSPHTTYESFHEILSRYVGTREETTRIESNNRSLNDDLYVQREPLQGVSSDRIADVCKQLDLFRSLQGDVSEPFWFSALGVLAYTTDGEQKAHEWSAGHANYSPVETADKFAHVSKQSGMTTCETLHSTSPQPDLCKTCPMFGKCKTPRAMELQAPKPNVIVLSADNDQPFDDLFADTIEPVTENIFIPEGWGIFEFDGFQSIHAWSNTDMPYWEAPHSEIIDRKNYKMMIRGKLYSPGCILDRMGNYTMKLIYLYGPANAKRKELIVTGSQITAMRELMSELGKKGIISLGGMERHLSDYVRSVAQHHQTQAQQSSLYNHYGWFEDDFLVGNTLYKSDGKSETVTLGKSIADKAHIVTPSGTLQEWKDIINTAYNHEGSEALQFAVLVGFAAPLMHHFKAYGGVTVHLYSQGSGKGKTTAAQAALSIWGNPTQMQLSDKQATINAIYATMGMYHSLPILYDEVTNKPDEEIADFVHVTSSGQPKQRCDTTGKIIENEHSWKTIVLSSGNKLLSDKLRSTRDNIEAETARIFEATVNVKHHIPSSEAIRLFAGLSTNYGHAGREFAKYITINKASVERALDKTLDTVGSKLGITSSERFWSVMLTSVLVAHAITSHLGLVQFDRQNLINWIKRTLAINRNTMAEVVPSVSDAFGRMMIELWGDVIVTLGEGTFVGGAWAEVRQKPKNKVVGRCIVDRIAENNKVHLSSHAIKQWCQKNGKNYKEFMTECIDNKLVTSYVSKYSLGKGTIEYDRLPETEIVTLTQSTVASMLSGGNLVSIPGGKSAEGSQEVKASS